MNTESKMKKEKNAKPKNFCVELDEGEEPELNLWRVCDEARTIYAEYHGIEGEQIARAECRRLQAAADAAYASKRDAAYRKLMAGYKENV